ncbi:helix-turn-helix domain-containing protein [Actinomadura sp. 9N215]|uniref:helix-turn-helix domain-containing protein n=1 Tax=Actinomadura sp. 9N215 TaxID=3375150 RepID=UPI0037B6E65A
MWNLIAYYLRFLRTERGETLRLMADTMGVAESTTSRIETGEQKLTERQAEEIDKAWKTGGLLGLMVYYARRASDPDWFRTYTDQEVAAAVIRMFANSTVPGLLQTEAYARALLMSGQEPDPQKSLERRMARQGILARTTPPRLWVTISENVLDWPVGGPEVMREQLARLVEVAELPNVWLRVVRRAAGAYPGLDGPFLIMSGPDGDADVFVDAARAGRLVTDSEEVRWFMERFELIGSRAESVDSSIELLKQAMERYQ